MTDEQILAALTKWGDGAMTYVAANVLRSEGHKVSTAQVRRRLMKLEREGRVKRTATIYATQIRWAPETPHDTPGEA